MRISFFIFISIFILTTNFSLLGQDNRKIDSLKKEISKSTEDKVKIDLINQIGWEYMYSDPMKALAYANQVLDLSTKFNYVRGKAIAYNTLASIDQVKSDYGNALEHYQISLEFYRAIGDSLNVAGAYNGIGVCSFSIADFNNALMYYQKALAIFEKEKSEQDIAMSYTNIGAVHQNLKSFEKAIDYFTRSMEVCKKINDESGILYSISNLGDVKFDTKKYAEALKDYNTAMKLAEKLKDVTSQADCHQKIGKTYYAQKLFNQAEEEFEQAYLLKLSLDEQAGIAQCLYELGRVKYAKKDVAAALENQNRSLKIADKIGHLDLLTQIYKELHHIYSAQGNYSQAYKYSNLFALIKDSIFNVAKNKQTTDSETRYQTAKKEKEIERKNAELGKNKIIMWTIGFGLFIVILLAGLIYKNYRTKQKANKLLSEQNTQISNQKDEIERQSLMVQETNNQLTNKNHEIEKKNEEIQTQSDILFEQKREITDSIVYAKRIQQAVMPPTDYLKEILPEFFIFYRPRDIVSGDFYWIRQQHDSIILSAADCTGHGVPGAFMSMLGVSFLNAIVANKEITQASEVLDEMRIQVKRALRQTGKEGEAKDGMDMTLCVLQNDFKKLQFSGAYNPLYLFRNNELIEYKGDRMPIGIHIVERTDFTNHEIDLLPGDIFYMFSDGFGDQIGGSKGGKLKKEGFKKMLLDIHQKPLAEQHQLIGSFIDNWMHPHYEQVDDMLIIGVRV